MIKGQKAYLALRALTIGMPVNIKGVGNVFLVEDDAEDLVLAIEGTKSQHGKPDEAVYLPVNLSLEDFINKTEQMSDDDAFFLSAEITINMEKQNRAKKRQLRSEVEGEQ